MQLCGAEWCIITEKIYERGLGGGCERAKSLENQFAYNGIMINGFVEYKLQIFLVKKNRTTFFCTVYLNPLLDVL
jgi:hypothetical protein